MMNNEFKRRWKLGHAMANSLIAAQGVDFNITMGIYDILEKSDSSPLRFGFNQRMREAFNAGEIGILIQD